MTRLILLRGGPADEHVVRLGMNVTSFEHDGTVYARPEKLRLNVGVDAGRGWEPAEVWEAAA